MENQNVKSNVPILDIRGVNDMAYIDLDEINRLHPKLTVKYPLSFANGISVAISEINRLPTADVVPKSEEGAECPTCHGTGRIGTTDWLTKNISKEQLAKEKAEAIAEHELHIKQDYAREIFEEIEKQSIYHFAMRTYSISELKFAKLKEKYTEVEHEP